MNTSFHRLQRIDLDDLDDVIGCKARWISTVKRKLEVEEEFNLNHGAFNSSSISKMTLAHWTGEAREIMTRQARLISKLTEVVELMKTEALADKAAIIRLQSDLLKNKDAELQSVKIAVQDTVQTSVQEGIKTYSSAVSSNVASTAPVLTAHNLKKAVKTAMVEEDRNKNLFVFGLSEEEDKNIEENVAELFHELGEYPHLQAVNRIGRTSSDETSSDCRPVKVTLTSTTSVNQILIRKARLKKTGLYKSVYVCPDLSPEERAARKQLVVGLKKAIEDQPKRHHCKKKKKIHSRDKAAS